MAFNREAWKCHPHPRSQWNKPNQKWCKLLLREGHIRRCYLGMKDMNRISQTTPSCSNTICIMSKEFGQCWLNHILGPSLTSRKLAHKNRGAPWTDRKILNGPAINRLEFRLLLSPSDFLAKFADEPEGRKMALLEENKLFKNKSARIYDCFYKHKHS